MTLTVDEALQNATLYTDNQLYNIVRLPATAIMAAAGVLATIGDPFSAVLADKDEVTLILPADLLAEFASRLPDHTVSKSAYRLITFDVELDMTMVGFMARVSTALADAGVSIIPIAAYTRDHILVAEAQFETAMSTLKQLGSK
jgi:hypothetical protein